jgi:RNA polymerase sigma-70 factor (ECF subfamily)
MSAAPEFQGLVDRYYEPLYRFGYSLAGNRDDACDLAQQTFFIWARQGHALRDGAKVKSWLFTTLFREFLKLHRHGKRVALMEEPELDAHATDIDADFIGRLDGDTVIEALKSVEDIYRAPLSLFYLEELSYKEIADVLSVPIGTVMSRLSRGKDQLRRILNQRAGPRATSATESDKIVPYPQPKPRPHHG